MAALMKKRDRMLVKRGSDCQSAIQDVPSLESIFTDISHLGTGRFSDVALAKHRKSSETVALKMFPRTEVKYTDFIREYNYSFFLAPHPNIVNTFEGLFSTHDTYYFVQEYCPTASLREAVYKKGGISEEQTCLMLKSVMSALEFMHDEGLVHRNIRAKNILVFDQEHFDRVKITDYALTRRQDAHVRNIDTPNEYHAPELCDVLVKETVVVDNAVDVWALGVTVYFCLIGKYPWQVARAECKPFAEWDNYIRRKSTAMPPKWGRFTEKGLKIFRKTLKTKQDDRITIKDLKKYTAPDKWLKLQVSKSSSAQSISNRSESRRDRRRYKADARPNSNAQSGRDPLIKQQSIDQPVNQSISNQSAIDNNQSINPHHSTNNNNNHNNVKPNQKCLSTNTSFDEHCAQSTDPDSAAIQNAGTEPKKKQRSAIHQFLSNTLATMTEISEQVVSATE